MGIKVPGMQREISVLSGTVLLLRWMFWLIKWAVIWPLATMVLFFMFVMWKENVTPGQMMVQEIERVRTVAVSGQFPVSDCSGKPATTTLPVTPGKPAFLKEDCPVTLTDAPGYAAHFDHSLKQLGQGVWLSLVLLYVAIAVTVGNRPYHRYDVVYGTAATRRLKEIYSDEKQGGE